MSARRCFCSKQRSTELGMRSRALKLLGGVCDVGNARRGSRLLWRGRGDGPLERDPSDRDDRCGCGRHRLERHRRQRPARSSLTSVRAAVCSRDTALAVGCTDRPFSTGAYGSRPRARKSATEATTRAIAPARSPVSHQEGSNTYATSPMSSAIRAACVGSSGRLKRRTQGRVREQLPAFA